MNESLNVLPSLLTSVVLLRRLTDSAKELLATFSVIRRNGFFSLSSDQLLQRKFDFHLQLIDHYRFLVFEEVEESTGAPEGRIRFGFNRKTTHGATSGNIVRNGSEKPAKDGFFGSTCCS